jgi:hypothetical protein
MYHLKKDPKEMNNLYGNPEYAAMQEQLKKQLKATRAEVKDSDAGNPYLQTIIDTHWDGGEEEAILISSQVAKNPVAVKKKGARK